MKIFLIEGLNFQCINWIYLDWCFVVSHENGYIPADKYILDNKPLRWSKFYTKKLRLDFAHFKVVFSKAKLSEIVEQKL